MGSIPSDGGSSLVSASIALSVLQVVFVAARFYTRYWQRMRCGADDYVILIALAGSLAKAIIYIVLVKVAGLGYHFDDESHPAESIALIRKGFFVLEILDFPLTITPAKISLLLFYVRIFYTRKFQITAYVVGSIVLALGITVFFQTIFQCSPIAYGWDSTIHHGKCIDQTLVYRVISPINVLTGVLILVMPMPLVWRIQAPRGQKVALTVVFVLGGLGFVESIRRMAIHFMNPKAELDTMTWFPVKLAIITVVEGAILIITGCLVTIWPLIIHLCPYRLVSALSCVPRARQHRCWYMMTQAPVTSEEHLTCVGRPRTRGEDRGDSSPSWDDLEEQRWWVSIEGGSNSQSCERAKRINVDQGLKA